jgi:hypothetical protein
MDVDADGSDSDRMPTSTGTPANFKPSTSYRWPKKTSEPNPYLAATEDGLKHAEAEFALSTTSPARKRDLRNVIAQLRAEISTLQKYSFLIGATDPFIVVPGTFLRGSDPVKLGDYALVIFGNAIYPALVGDVGPNDKAGEASLRIAKEINTLSTPYNRPVSDLKVTYLIFPETAEKLFGPPDLEKLQARCETLVKEIGGASVPLHHWENIIPPSPTPSPVSSPMVSPCASASPSPGVSPTGPVSPSPTFAFPVPSPAGAGTSAPTLTPKSSPAAKRSPIKKHKP